ncbi:hypothetical protein CRYUN_Cryun38cG0032700 [Craigia yunnanensis]
MLRAKLSFFCLLLALSLSLFPDACIARLLGKNCGSSSCGNINISYPFRLKTQPQSCGFILFELACENNRTIFPMRYGNFYVQDISYVNRTIHLLDVNLVNDNCFIPHSSSPWYTPSGKNIGIPLSAGYDTAEFSVMYLLSCRMKMINSSVYIDASRCSTNRSSHSPTPPTNYCYFLDGETEKFSDFHQSCIIVAQVPIMLSRIRGLSNSDIYKKLMMGFKLSWSILYFVDSLLRWNSVVKVLVSLLLLLFGVLCLYVTSILAFFQNGTLIQGVLVTSPVIEGIILARTFLGIFCLIALIIHKLRRRHLSFDDTIESFLQNQKNLMPIRYSYSEIKRITEGFKNKLGQCGFGSVFKGKLRSDKLVAIKLLSKKVNGQDFINEVATIGRIHHVNVVQLIGFCLDGSKQALVYDFMTNASLDKIIFSTESSSLSWQNMFEIALGVARGIEYLHRGCEMQILHFDIKPHNILLNENFNPKVSDFGLAKLNSVDDSIISLTGARGTMRYMAPELFYRSLGGISYKADVYSFGMMLMEIVGRRKNVNASADHSSQIYFPIWIYDRFDKGENIELGDVTESEKKIVRKMVLVAFWCIQTRPTNRPSMNKVLEMLESEVEPLEIPPKSFLFSQDMLCEDSN